MQSSQNQQLPFYQQMLTGCFHLLKKVFLRYKTVQCCNDLYSMKTPAAKPMDQVQGSGFSRVCFFYVHLDVFTTRAMSTTCVSNVKLIFSMFSLTQAVIGKFISPSTAVPDPLKSNLNLNSDVMGGGGVWH